VIALLSDSVFVRALGFTLLHFVWQGALVAAALFLALAALSRATASARCAASCVALALMALAPIATFAVLYTHPPSAAWLAPALALDGDRPRE
jgi:hypothetical protein